MIQVMTVPTLAQLQEGVEIATQIEAKERQLREMLAGMIQPAAERRSIPGIPTLGEVRGSTRPRPTKHRHSGLTEAGRKRLSQAMKRRWAERRAATAFARRATRA